MGVPPSMWPAGIPALLNSAAMWTLCATSTAKTTVFRPSPSLCQWVQDNENPGDPTWEARLEQCKRNVIAAQHDIQGAVRWIRDHAAQYDVDPNKIAVGGFSAGAVTSANLAYRSDDIGTVPYFAGDDLSVSGSRVQAAIGASGCLYSLDGGPLTDPGAGAR